MILHLHSRSLRFANSLQMLSHHHAFPIPPQSPSLPHFKHNAESNDTIKVHIIPHSHDDLGWLKTVNEYYWGSRRDIQPGQVQYILDSVISSLASDKSKTFVYAEVFFFMKWWAQQSEDQRSLVKSLIKSGQFEFVNGGLAMNDEACAYFEDIVEQFVYGQRFLRETFNISVEIGWQLDPFGHSFTQRDFFEAMGFEALFFARADYKQRILMTKQREMEFLWGKYQGKSQGNSPEPGGKDGLFSVLTYFHYSSPPGFCFDELCEDEPVIDDPEEDGYNIIEKSLQLVEYFKNMREHYQQPELLHLFGDDFQYSNAAKHFKNIDKLLKFINNHPEWGVQLEYSTPSRYVRAINRRNLTYSVRKTDFFPYIDAEHAFWTGFFSSRPVLKAMVKETGRLLQIVRNLLVISTVFQRDCEDFGREIRSSLENLQKTVGIMQHHDAVAGTSTQKVAEDYKEIMRKSVRDAKKVLNKLLLRKFEDFAVSKHELCDLPQFPGDCKEIYQALKEKKKVTISVYFPASSQAEVLRIRVPSGLQYKISKQNLTIPHDLICDSHESSTFCTIFLEVSPKIAHSFDFFVLQSTEIPTNSSENPPKAAKLCDFPANSTEITLSFADKRLKIGKSMDNFAISSKNSKEFAFNLSYESYKSEANADVKSGAYIFRASVKENEGKSRVFSKPERAYCFDGEIVKEIRIEGTAAFSKKLRVFSRFPGDFLEIETHVPTIASGNEVILRIASEIRSNGSFLTDSNGLSLISREKSRNSSEIAGNYYPISSMIGVEDEEISMFLLTDRAEGATSVENGTLEAMLQRRLESSDNRGLAEFLNETEAFVVRHQLIFEEKRREMNRRREIQYRNDLFPLVFMGVLIETPRFQEKNAGNLTKAKVFVEKEGKIEGNLSRNSTENAGKPGIFAKNGEKTEKLEIFPKKSAGSLEKAVDLPWSAPELVRIYLEDWDEERFLLRLMNNSEKDEKIVEIRTQFEEKALNGMENIKEKRLIWNNFQGNREKPKETQGKIALKPLEIRTFLVKKPQKVNEKPPNPQKTG